MIRKALCHLMTALVLWGAMPADPAAAVSEALRARIEDLWDTGRLDIEGSPVASVSVLPLLYEKGGFEPLWRSPDAVEQLLSAIEEIHRDGLTPDDYHFSALRAMAGADGGTPERRAGFDILMTDALLRLSAHLFFGKVDPASLDRNWNLDREVDGREAVDAVAAALGSGRIREWLDGLRPARAQYRRLVEALDRYRRIRAAGGWPRVPGGEVLKTGMRGPQVENLRRRLLADGDLDGGAGADPALFDEALEAGLVRFQERHGLDADGVAGPRTLAALDVPVEARIDQIRVNLERARWILHQLSGRFVLVDIAGFRVHLFENDEVVWSSRAQVGRPYRRTPVFRDEIRYLVFNPTWTVPPGILRNDILPQLRRDPGMLQRRNMVVLDGKGRTVDPATVQWSRYPGRPFPYRIRQEPGPDNALGRIKFMFPNDHLVYLHDTPSKALFEPAERAFSSGCIRVQKPFELAELLLNDPVKWGARQIGDLVESKRTRTVNLPEPVPVLLLYWTVAVGEDGTVSFKPDLYERDGALLKALDAAFRPGDWPPPARRIGTGRGDAP